MHAHLPMYQFQDIQKDFQGATSKKAQQILTTT